MDQISQLINWAREAEIMIKCTQKINLIEEVCQQSTTISMIFLLKAVEMRS